MEFILLISGVLGTQVHEDTVIAVLIVAARLHIAPDHDIPYVVDGDASDLPQGVFPDGLVAEYEAFGFHFTASRAARQMASGAVSASASPKSWVLSSVLNSTRHGPGK